MAEIIYDLSGNGSHRSVTKHIFGIELQINEYLSLRDQLEYLEARDERLMEGSDKLYAYEIPVTSNINYNKYIFDTNLKYDIIEIKCFYIINKIRQHILHLRR